MAQKSKKAFIIETALPIFLENGFKGTSIDQVVKRSGVSKPTVYNHFPDKAALMSAVLEQWIESRKPLILPVKNLQELEQYVETQWLSEEVVRLYALVIGEGWRFPQAKKLFWEHFDGLWRKALIYVSLNASDFDQTSIERLLDHRLLNRLKQL